MSLQFEDQNNLLIRRNMYTEHYGPIVTFLLKYRIANNEKNANRILLTIAIIILLVAGVIIARQMIKSNAPVKVKYNLSKEVFNRLPQNVQLKIISE